MTSLFNQRGKKLMFVDIQTDGGADHLTPKKVNVQTLVKHHGLVAGTHINSI